MAHSQARAEHPLQQAPLRYRRGVRRTLALLIAATVLTSCTTRGAKYSAAGLGVAAVGSLLIATAVLDESAGTSTNLRGFSGFALLLGGAVAFHYGMYIGVRGFLHTEEPPPAPLAPDPVAIARARAREEAWQKTKAAMTASRQDDCASVQAIDPQVRALDVDFYESVFARDLGIRRCLAR